MTMRAADSGTSSPPGDDHEPSGLPVAPDVLDHTVADEALQVEAAESELRRLGLEGIRVRHHGELARLEAPHRDLASLAAEPLRGEVLRAVRSAGFRSVAVDLDAVPASHEG
jgi:PP-loop superfamily ATP-utilizing enzyme